MKFCRLSTSKQQGFTIIELMIATTVVSVILVMTTVIMISIGKLYYKGISQARVQDDVRAITDEIAQQLQLTDTAPLTQTVGNTTSICIGTTRYTFVIGRQIGPDGSLTPAQSAHVFWRDTVPDTNCAPPANNQLNDPTLGTNTTTKQLPDGINPFDLTARYGSDGVELIAPRSRLAAFSINGTAGVYTVSVNIAYGDNDLLCSPTAVGTCSNPNTMAAAFFANGDLTCKGRTADSYCGTANLKTTALQRLR